MVTLLERMAKIEQKVDNIKEDVCEIKVLLQKFDKRFASKWVETVVISILVGIIIAIIVAVVKYVTGV